jgi:hypothetical protein
MIHDLCGYFEKSKIEMRFSDIEKSEMKQIFQNFCY